MKGHLRQRGKNSRELRARQPHDDFANKEATLSARITAATRKRLDAAAETSGRSLSQEIEKRLADTFDTDDSGPKIVSDFGNQETYAALRIAADVIREAERFTGGDWRRHPFTFDVAVDAVDDFLRRFRPVGSDEPPDAFPVMPEPPGIDSFPQAKAWLRQTRAGLRAALLKECLGEKVASNAIAFLQLAPNSARPSWASLRKVSQYFLARLTSSSMRTVKGRSRQKLRNSSQDA